MTTPRDNPAQIAPGEDASLLPIGEPYAGYAPGVHVGYPLNWAFQEGVASAKN